MERIIFIERDTIQATFRRPNFDHEWIEYPESAAEEVPTARVYAPLAHTI